MEEKYYINIEENRRIVGRYLDSIHGENIPSTAKEVTEDVFNNSIKENHNFLSEDLKSYYQEIDDRTEEEKKQAKINEINSKAYYEISLLYPEWKQANITADYLQYPDNEIFKKNFEDMRLYINQIRTNADLEVMKLKD